MSFVPWSDALSVGVPAIDTQHRKLVDHVNELHDAMIERRGREVLGQMLSGLVAHTKEHFATEEALMERAGYPEFLAHRNLHEILVRKVEELAERHAAGGITVSIETMTFLRDWLQNHILKSDRAAGRHIAGVA